jgi:hypothetical protein
MDNPETYETLCKRHRTKGNKTKYTTQKTKKIINIIPVTFPDSIDNHLK